LGTDHEDYPRVDNLSACTDCDLCVKVCPGDEFNFSSHHLSTLGAAGNLSSTHGKFDKAVLAYSSDENLRQASTSGGLVTQILLHLLDSGDIDGALLVTSDQERLWKGRPILARSRDEIIAAAKSKYAITPTNVSFAQIRNEPGRYALVGLPCQIHGYLKAAALDEKIRDRVVLTIGLFCHAAIEHEAFEIIWRALGEKARGARRFVSRLGKHPGAPHIELQDGEMYPVYFGHKTGYRPSSMEMINILYRLYTPARCLTCFDALSEFADISVGDPWMSPPTDDIDFSKGYSFALIRTARGQAALQKAAQSGTIRLFEVTKNEALACNAHMSEEKRWRAFRVIETHRRQGKPIPDYGSQDFQMPHHSLFQFLKTERNMLSHIFCFLPGQRATVLRFCLGNGGYLLLWVNNKRRRFKLWLRDSLARAKRILFGRK
jgi:coenzyme F420 hydrogenase subunit beta